MSRSRSFLLFSLIAICLISLFLLPSAVRSQESDDEVVTDSSDYDDSSEREELAVTEDGESDVEQVEMEEVLDDAGSLIGDLEPHPDLEFSIFFPNAADKKFVQDSDVTALVSVSNVGPEAFNLSYSGAHLHSAVDYSYYVQNLSVYHVDMILQPGSQATVEYHFRADPNLEPVDFLFSGWLIYNNTAGKIFKSNFANTTVWLVEQPIQWDFKHVSTYGIILAFLGGLGYLVYTSFLGGGKKGKSKRTRNPGQAAGEPAKPPPVWEAENVYKPSTGPKPVSRKRSNKPASNKKE